MNGFKRLATFVVAIVIVTGCATTAVQDDIDIGSATNGAEDLAALDSNPAALSADALEADLDQAKPEDNLGQVEQKQDSGKDEFADFEEPKAQEPPPPEQIPEPEIAKAPEPPPPAPEAPPVPEAPAEAAPRTGLITLKSILYKANDNGGTVIIDADGPMTYSTRMNAASGQFVVDIPQSILPKKLTRPLIMKDFEGMVGSVDAYQSPGSNISRVVVHLRPGSAEPVVQSEGSSLLVVSSEAPRDPIAPEQVKLLSYDSLEDFLAGNMQFSGKKISIEVANMEVSGIFRLIAEEANINLIISDDVKGLLTLKLRQVPWDQAMVMVMRAKKLSYTKTGNVLRIVPIAELRAEEDDSVKMAASKRSVAPLKVKLIPISYAKIEDIEKQVKSFLSVPRGTVISDARTSSLVVSDIEENLDRILKLVQSIDIPPQQVLIEGKIIEASDQFERQMGIQWQASGKPVAINDNIRSTTSLGVTPGSISGSTGTLNFSMGTLDFLGDLTATLTMKETEGLVKVLSSPRIVTLHNETADISQTQELPIITSTVSNGIVTPSVQFKPVRLKLGVTPQITNDGAVIMKVEVNREFAGEVVNTQTQARSINSRVANTKVLVRNGQTAVIGGIYQNDSTESEGRVPWLGQLPVVGWLFKNKAKSSQKNELLIFLTPRIVGQLDSQAIPESGSRFGNDGLGTGSATESNPGEKL